MGQICYPKIMHWLSLMADHYILPHFSVRQALVGFWNPSPTVTVLAHMINLLKVLSTMCHPIPPCNAGVQGNSGY